MRCTDDQNFVRREEGGQVREEGVMRGMGDGERRDGQRKTGERRGKFNNPGRIKR